MGLDLISPLMAYNVVFYQMTYASSLLSFTGAVHWGLAMADYQCPFPQADATEQAKRQLTPNQRRWLRYGFGMVPLLVAWGALAVPTQLYGMAAIMGGYGAVFVGDWIADKYGLVPPWYMKLRAPFTIGATIALGLSLMVHL